MCEHIFKINKTLKDDWGTLSGSVLVIYARERNTYVCQNRMAPFWKPHIISKHQMLPLGAGISGTRRKCRNLIYSQQWLIASQKGISRSTNGPLVWKGSHSVPPFPMYVLGMGSPYSMAHGNNEESKGKWNRVVQSSEQLHMSLLLPVCCYLVFTLWVAAQWPSLYPCWLVHSKLRHVIS